MGVKNLWEILDSCKKTLPLHHLQNKRFCIDLSYWIVQLQNASRTPAFAKEKCYLRSLFHRLRALLALNCSLIFDLALCNVIFHFAIDGSIPAIKLTAYRQRLGSGSEVARDESNLQGLIEEAEAQCALLNSESLCDGCFTADSDVFLFGAKTVYRDIYLVSETVSFILGSFTDLSVANKKNFDLLGDGGYVVCYEMADVKRKLGFGRNSLFLVHIKLLFSDTVVENAIQISFGLLLGSDYSHGVHGIGPVNNVQETACQIIKSVGDGLILQRIASEVAIVKKSWGSKKQGKVTACNADKENLIDKQNINDSVQSAGLNNQFLQVIDAYLNPKCHSPDSEAVQSVLVPHPFQRKQLGRICAGFFGWTPEKTDEYILPKIAERDLRRFANLRNTGQELGVHIPLNRMCVKCPVSAIVQERKIQGRDFFEVSWNDIDGLKTSTVPADLVESACPEKIAEYMERRAEAKQAKRKRKPTKASQKPQAPLPSTESDRHDAACLNPVGPKTETNLIDLSTPSPIRVCKTSRFQDLKAGELDEQLRGLFLSIEPQANDILDANACQDSVAPSNVESEIIDLSTPLAPAQLASRPGKNVEGQMDVIQLSDLENSISPEHTAGHCYCPMIESDDPSIPFTREPGPVP
ncbi:hypothetical protein ACLOJK_024523 [Asimina triloba]